MTPGANERRASTLSARFIGQSRLKVVLKLPFLLPENLAENLPEILPDTLPDTLAKTLWENCSRELLERRVRVRLRLPRKSLRRCGEGIRRGKFNDYRQTV